MSHMQPCCVYCGEYTHEHQPIDTRDEDLRAHYTCHMAHLFPEPQPRASEAELARARQMLDEARTAEHCDCEYPDYYEGVWLPGDLDPTYAKRCTKCGELTY